MVFASFFITIFVIDLEHHLIPNRVVYPAILGALGIAFLTRRYEVLQLLWGGLGGAGKTFLSAPFSPSAPCSPCSTGRTSSGGTLHSDS